MKTMLLMMPMWDVDVPPMGLSYLAGALKIKGHPVLAIDLNVIMYRNFHKTSQELDLWDGSFTLSGD